MGSGALCSSQLQELPLNSAYHGISIFLHNIAHTPWYPGTRQLAFSANCHKIIFKPKAPAAQEVYLSPSQQSYSQAFLLRAGTKASFHWMQTVCSAGSYPIIVCACVRLAGRMEIKGSMASRDLVRSLQADLFLKSYQMTLWNILLALLVNTKQELCH